MSSLTPEILEVVGQFRELTDAGQLRWKTRESLRGGGQAVEVSLATGHWRITPTGAANNMAVRVRDDTGDVIYDFSVGRGNPHYTEIVGLYEAAMESNRRRAAKAIEKMSEELAARAR